MLGKLWLVACLIYIQVNLSKLTDSDQIFRNDLVCLHHHLCKNSTLIIECKYIAPYFFLQWTFCNNTFCFVIRWSLLSSYVVNYLTEVLVNTFYNNRLFPVLDLCHATLGIIGSVWRSAAANYIVWHLLGPPPPWRWRSCTTPSAYSWRTCCSCPHLVTCCSGYRHLLPSVTLPTTPHVCE